MEVEEENTSNHLPESTTTVAKENSLENNSRNDIELGVEVPESNTQEKQGEESSVIVPKLDDPHSFVAVAVGETAEEEKVIVERRNSEPGGCFSSVVVEPTSLLKNEKDGAEGATNDGISTSDVAVTERGGSELTISTKVDVGECEAAVIVRDNALDVVDENVNKSEEDISTNGSFVTVNDKGGGEGGGEDAPLLPVAEIGEAMADVKSDGDEIVLGDEAITEAQAEVVADEEEEKSPGVTENDEEEPTVADEEKSLDTDLDTDEEATMADEENLPTEEMEAELPESVGKVGRRKRKRGGKNSKVTPKSTPGRKKIADEDVCFICYDGGDLVLCDLRTCPKAYHPSCVNRDPAFFQTKGRWNCVGLYQ